MLIVSQYKDKTTECLEFIIKEITTCKSVFIDKASYEKFKKITQKKDDGHISIKELKGLGELMEKNMTKQVYTIIERKDLIILEHFHQKIKQKKCYRT